MTWIRIRSLLNIILSFLSGPIRTISNDLKEAYQSRLVAETDRERLAAQERIEVLEARKTAILAAQADPFERWVRIGFAFPFVVYIHKLVIWDKVLGWGTTDNLSPDLWYILWIVLGGYFIDTAIKRIKMK